MYKVEIFDPINFSVADFQSYIYDYYSQHQRIFDWRVNPEPYYVFVSEIMLQQTQTTRVIDKFRSWISRFPDFYSLASASQEDVLKEWMGLGYNRRALWTHQAAQFIVNNHKQELPKDPSVLVTIKGIGKNTAGSMIAFAYNIPTLFIETNIRTVFIALFFPGQHNVNDKELLPLIEKTIDKENPRIWYYALMDFGVFLKKNYPNPSRASAHHQKQSTFEGSQRQLRANILRFCLDYKGNSLKSDVLFLFRDERTAKVLQALSDEGFLHSSLLLS